MTKGIKNGKQLKQVIKAAARKAIADGFTPDMIDDHPGGNVHQWCAANIAYRTETAFFVVFLVGCAIADEFAQRKGYRDQADLAAQFMRRN